MQTSFIDGSGAERQAAAESLQRVLTALGSPCGTEAEAASAEKEKLEQLRNRRIEPVTIVWETKPAFVAVRFPGGVGAAVQWSIKLESGKSLTGRIEPGEVKTKPAAGPDGQKVESALLPLPKQLPAGYHKLTLEIGSDRLETHLLVAPERSYRAPEEEQRRDWGVFAPLYALTSDRSLGCGDLSDLRELASWTSGLGGRVVATLPLLACFLGEKPGPFDPSPYAPVSRLFWNELFIDPTKSPEFVRCTDARAVMNSSNFQIEAGSIRDAELVDYRRAAGLKRSVLEKLAGQFERDGGRNSQSFKQFQIEQPLASEYAAFRAVTERQGKDWAQWPAKLQKGTLTPSDYDPAVARYHVYAQYLAWMELLALGSEIKSAGGVMYLDLPVGVSPFGYDTWKFRDQFAAGCSTGAPPDPYFTGGQNWGFPPMHPETVRRDAYAYLRACLRNHMRHAEYLRLDHVMAFHRLFWIPDGMSAADGVYVQYHAEELYAILCIESHRHRCRLVGENLGTVPPEVNEALHTHDLCGLYVAQYEMQPQQPALRPVPANCVASVNTHDMAPFAAYWSGQDIDDRIGLGMLDESKRDAERSTRGKQRDALIAQMRKDKRLPAGKADEAALRDAMLAHLCESPADFVLVSLEDLWLETKWQNVPGTMDQHPNWRRRFKMQLEQLQRNAGVVRVLKAMNAARKGAAGAKPAKPAAKEAAPSAPVKEAATKPAKAPAVRELPAKAPSKSAAATKNSAKPAPKKVAKAPAKPAPKPAKQPVKKAATKPAAKKAAAKPVKKKLARR
ncbi:MAG: 4-alpha-glucanotransferase [Planctomycetota bacterium]|nr:4-alpha-glucanotransferase [Planctomycetota bacterium]